MQATAQAQEKQVIKSNLPLTTISNNVETVWGDLYKNTELPLRHIAVFV